MLKKRDDPHKEENRQGNQQPMFSYRKRDSANNRTTDTSDYRRHSSRRPKRLFETHLYARFRITATAVIASSNVATRNGMASWIIG